MNTNNQPNRTRIFEHMTKTRFLHIEDSLEIGKLRFFLGSYEKGKGASATTYAFLDLDDARVLLSDLAWGKPVKFVDYKGGKNGGGKIISRVLKANTKIEGDKSQVWIEIQNGEGEIIGEGAVKPKPGVKPDAEVSLSLTVLEARKLAHACLAYMQAWQAAQMVGKLIGRTSQPEDEDWMQPA